MQIRVLGGAMTVVAAVALSACGTTTATHSTESMSPSPSTSMAAHSMAGTFAGLNGKHVAGSVSVSGGQIVLSGFSSDEGPDLHVYLTTGTTEAAVAAGRQISPVSFNTASQTFALNGVDASMYNTVVIHCDKAKAVFGAASLS